ncbi:MAG TPA: hypothetical protein PK293_10930 [Spirochaetota bacterium]|nr:hypothetical protein [Spirochaetota bacterium]HPF06541.1 hypothetical protein [Spirochaetota bacterium]HPJ42948.1 hypothetical protein [Spirochaetota bacterium]HPR36384.1 hypothetical protein [Spirochaetota bacterium]
MQSIFSFSGKRFFYKRKHKLIHDKTTVRQPDIIEGEDQEPVYRDEYVTIIFYRKSGILCQEWRGFCPGTEFRAAIDFIFNFMTEKNIYKTICDVRYQRVVPPSCQKYVEEKVLGYIKSYGSFFTAFVALEKSVGGVCAGLYDMHLTQKLGYRINGFFDNVQDAETWLNEK